MLLPGDVVTHNGARQAVVLGTVRADRAKVALFFAADDVRHVDKHDTSYSAMMISPEARRRRMRPRRHPRCWP